MSELSPRPDEAQPQVSSELRLRERGRASAKLPGIARHGRLKKSSPLGVIFGFVAASLAVLLVSGATLGALAVNALNSNLQANTVTLIGETDGPPPSIGAYEGGFNILIVGSDTRSGQNGIGSEDGEEDGELNDVNILLHVSADQTNAVAVSFPRDLVVGIPECPDSDGDTKGYSTEPINVALSYGGLSCAVLTVSELTGLPIQFAGLITFTGVINMSDAVGGVPVCVTGPIYDGGIVFPEAGTYTLVGTDALAFLRNRSGVGDGSDLTRISSQQVYLSSLVRQLKSSQTLGDPSRVYQLALAASQNLQLSSSLADIPTMMSIALALKDIPLERVTFVQYPGRTGGDGIYAGKVRPDSVAGDQLMAYIAADQPFLLTQAGDGRGSTIDPNAPTAPVDPDAPVVDNTGLPTLDGVSGQTAANYTCSVANN